MASLQVITGDQLLLPGMKTSDSADMGLRLVYAGASTVAAWRPAGTLQHPNFFGSYLVAIIPSLFLLVALGVTRIGRRAWTVSAVLLGAALLTLLLTLSRAGWIACFAAGVTAFVVAVHRGFISRNRATGLVASCVLFIMLVLPLYPAAFYRITRSDERSSESRIIMMRQAALIISEHPIIGGGLASYQSAAKRNLPPELAPYGEGTGTRFCRAWCTTLTSCTGPSAV